MFRSHLPIDGQEEEKKADDRGEVLEVADASQQHYAHYTFGTNVTRKPYGFGNGLDQILAERGIYRAPPVYDIPNKELVFSFIAAVLRETHGPAEDPIVTMSRVKDQIAVRRLQPFDEALRVLQGDMATEPEYLQKYLRKTRKKAEGANENPINIVLRHMAVAQSELYDNFKIIFDTITPHVMRTLLKRIDWEWREELRDERRELAKKRDALHGQAYLEEHDRQIGLRQASRVGETVEGMTLIKAYMQHIRPELPRQTEPQYNVSPKLIVRIDPLWDDKLPFAAKEKKKEILQKVICLLGQNISSKDFSKVHISRITKTLEGYKVWFMNEVNVMGSSTYVHRRIVDDAALHQTQIIHQGQHGFSVSALIADSSADVTSTRFQPTYNPLFVRIKTADLDAANLAELAEVMPASDFEDRYIEQAIFDSTARMVALVNKDVDESAKLEMNMDLSTDPEVNSANEDAKAHLEKIKIQLQVLGERVRVLSQDSALDVRARVLHNPDNAKLFHDVEILREKVVSKIRHQILDVDAQRKELEWRTQEMSRAFNEKMMADDNIAAAETMSTPLRLTLSEFFSFNNATSGVVFAKLCEDLVSESERAAITTPELLGSHIKNHLNTRRLLEKINYILLMYPKQKNQDASVNKAFADFSTRLKASLMEQLNGLPAFELGKATGGKLIYNPEKLMEQMRYEHETRIQADKKLLLDKIHQVGQVREEIDECSHVIQTLGHRFENESSELVQIKKSRDVIDEYIQEISSMLGAINREVAYMVPEFFASMRIFSPQMSKKQGDVMTQDLTTRQQKVTDAINTIALRLKKIINTSAALHSVGARVNDLDEFERRFGVNKNMIDSLRRVLNTTVGEIIGVTIPLISQKKILDHAYNEIYQNLKTILIDDIQSWVMRAGGEFVMVDELPYRVPHRFAAIIKAMQAADSDGSLSPGEKLKSILLPQAASLESVASKGMFNKKMAAVKQGLTDMKHPEKVLKLSAIVEELRQLAKTPHFNNVEAFSEPHEGLLNFAKKKSVAVRRQAPQAAKTAASRASKIMLEADAPVAEPEASKRRPGRPKKK